MADPGPRTVVLPARSAARVGPPVICSVGGSAAILQILVAGQKLPANAVVEYPWAGLSFTLEVFAVLPDKLVLKHTHTPLIICDVCEGWPAGLAMSVSVIKNAASLFYADIKLCRLLQRLAVPCP